MSDKCTNKYSGQINIYINKYKYVKMRSAMQNSRTRCEEEEHREGNIYQGIRQNNSEKMTFMLDSGRAV